MKVDDLVSGKVTFIAKTHLIAKLEDGASALLHISEVSDYFVGSMSSMFELNKWYDFVVIDMDSKEGIKLSWKKIVPRYLKNPFSYDIEETKNGFKNLKKFIKEEVDND